jgi:hypothetical protein
LPKTEATSTRPCLLLLDGHSLAYQAFYALKEANLVTTDGQHTEAVYGFTSMLVNVLRDEQPTHVAVCFDRSEPTFRHEEYADYKANRSETPEDFRGQVSLIFEVLDTLRVPRLSLPGFEADDLIATLATRASEQGMSVLIVTGDRDALQLDNDQVTVLMIRRGISEMTLKGVNTRLPGCACAETPVGVAVGVEHPRRLRSSSPLLDLLSNGRLAVPAGPQRLVQGPGDPRATARGRGAVPSVRTPAVAILARSGDPVSSGPGLAKALYVHRLVTPGHPIALAPPPGHNSPPALTSACTRSSWPSTSVRSCYPMVNGLLPIVQLPPKR